MVTSTATPPPVAETAGEHLVLRVCGTTRDGQVVQLKSAKCTIGSGPRCTLRLRARGVQPVHCLIVRGSAGTVVRRWSADTRLNGRAFTDAELVDGDRLSVGAIELEVLESGRLPSPDPAESPEAPLPQPPSLQGCGPSRLDLRRIDRLTARLRLANRQGRQRARRLLEKLRAANREVAQLRESRAERPELERQLNEQAEAIDARTSDLDRQQDACERERRECQAKLAETEEQLRQRGERLDADRAELKAQQEAFERHRQQSENEHAAIASQPEQEEPPTDSQRPQQPEPQEAPSEGPIDISDVFRRMGSGGLPSDEEPRPEPPAEPEPQPSEIPAAEEPSPAPRAAEDGGEESIEDYMSRLMDRVHAIRGDAEREERRPEESPPPQSPPPDSPPQESLPEESLPEQPVEPEPQV
ncbi:MAG: FHA domain-containing protein, partial [Planctomycetota bacterium]